MIYKIKFTADSPKAIESFRTWLFGVSRGTCSHVNEELSYISTNIDSDVLELATKKQRPDGVIFTFSAVNEIERELPEHTMKWMSDLFSKEEQLKTIIAELKSK